MNVGVVWNVLKAHVERDKDLLLATDRGRAIYEAIASAPPAPAARIREALMLAGHGAGTTDTMMQGASSA
ncbi:hypothetical protein GCM10025868_27360 [Angustibacter aerolatus]|uniref:Transcriptional regulator n=1 Tax=Angustibacter aerolatus TaxID=1162965 RepID=A0ABQ6JJ88_9ACTN|nr:hypothetical protein GCM10025868_27330 [Angustibacter aerolatus]GMA87486.1 hypothetical protein GCM10025868_27360 [Angustibacter aerolatus]